MALGSLGQDAINGACPRKIKKGKGFRFRAQLKDGKIGKGQNREGQGREYIDKI
jgi:hypothetical protein